MTLCCTFLATPSPALFLLLLLGDDGLLFSNGIYVPRPRILPAADPHATDVRFPATLDHLAGCGP